MCVLDLVDLVTWLPAGSPLWVSFGGPASLSVEAHQMRAIEFRLRELEWITAGGKGARPQPPEPPKYAHERVLQQTAMNRKAQAFLARERAREARDMTGG